VRQHGSESHVADALDALDGRVELVVDDDSASLVRLDTDGLEVEALGDGSSANSDEDDVGLDLKVSACFLSSPGKRIMEKSGR
jgi:hypothetical protein